MIRVWLLLLCAGCAAAPTPAEPVVLESPAAAHPTPLDELFELFEGVQR